MLFILSILHLICFTPSLEKHGRSIRREKQNRAKENSPYRFRFYLPLPTLPLTRCIFSRPWVSIRKTTLTIVLSNCSVPHYKPEHHQTPHICLTQHQAKKIYYGAFTIYDWGGAEKKILRNTRKFSPNLFKNKKSFRPTNGNTEIQVSCFYSTLECDIFGAFCYLFHFLSTPGLVAVYVSYVCMVYEQGGLKGSPMMLCAEPLSLTPRV